MPTDQPTEPGDALAPRSPDQPAARSADSQRRPAVSPATIDRFLDNQSRSLEVQMKQMEYTADDQKRQHEFALASLQAQERSNQNLFQVSTQQRRQVMIFSLIVLGMILVFCGYMAVAGFKELITSLLDKVIPALIAGFGGYFYGKHKASEEFEESGDDE